MPRSSRALGVLLALFAVLMVPATPASAQERDPIPLSQHQIVTQSIGWVDVEVEYRRPVARGRALFGALVPWNEEWTPSADSAMVVTVSDDVWIAGEPVPAGSYSLWLVPRENAAWTLILSNAARIFHAPYPGGRDFMRVEVDAETGEHVETLQMAFPTVSGPEARLELQWGETRLPLRIRILPPA